MRGSVSQKFISVVEGLHKDVLGRDQLLKLTIGYPPTIDGVHVEVSQYCLCEEIRLLLVKRIVFTIDILNHGDNISSFALLVLKDLYSEHDRLMERHEKGGEDKHLPVMEMNYE